MKQLVKSVGLLTLLSSILIGCSGGGNLADNNDDAESPLDRQTSIPTPSLSSPVDVLDDVEQTVDASPEPAPEDEEPAGDETTNDDLSSQLDALQADLESEFQNQADALAATEEALGSQIAKAEDAADDAADEAKKAFITALVGSGLGIAATVGFGLWNRNTTKGQIKKLKENEITELKGGIGALQRGQGGLARKVDANGTKLSAVGEAAGKAVGLSAENQEYIQVLQEDIEALSTALEDSEQLSVEGRAKMQEKLAELKGQLSSLTESSDMQSTSIAEIAQAVADLQAALQPEDSNTQEGVETSANPTGTNSDHKKDDGNAQNLRQKSNPPDALATSSVITKVEEVE